MVDEDTLCAGDILFDRISGHYVLVTYVKKDRVDDNSKGVTIYETNYLCINLYSYALRGGEYRHVSDQEKAFVLLKMEFLGINV